MEEKPYERPKEQISPTPENGANQKQSNNPAIAILLAIIAILTLTAVGFFTVQEPRE